MGIVVKVQAEDFDAGAEMAALRVGKPAVGAIASFVGLVRDQDGGSGRAHAAGTTVDARIDTLTLEHYPGMTERSLERICTDACERWALIDVLVIHRYGTLHPTDQIVLVATSSSHRADAFDACRFVMDWLKTDAPFWKKESGPAGDRWVEARDSDQAAVERWSVDDHEIDATKHTA